jgi:Flp pilus assembly protein TadG
MQAWRRLRHDESGMSYAFVGMGLAAFLSASMLAIDVGMLMTARNQAQNAADAGALAGATALYYDDFEDRTSDGPAVTSAIATAKANTVMSRLDGRSDGGGIVDVTPADVEFLDDELGQPTRVKVTVYRNAARGNPISTLIAGIISRIVPDAPDMETAGVAATATAEAAPANAVNCPLPFTIPDRWRETNNPPWDPIEDDYDAVDNHGDPVAHPDVYIGPEDPVNYTGYNAERDIGMLVVLKADNGSKLAPSMYQVWDTVGGDRGSDDVRDAIINCRSTDMMGFGQTFVHKPGMQTGPVAEGIADLIAQDPDAYWDEGEKKVVSTHPSGRSPRVRPIPLFDPYYYDTGVSGGRNASLLFVNYLGFFIEEMRGNEVVGRVCPIGGSREGSNFGPAPQVAFPKAIRLVK